MDGIDSCLSFSFNDLKAMSVSRSYRVQLPIGLDNNLHVLMNILRATQFDSSHGTGNINDDCLFFHFSRVFSSFTVRSGVWLISLGEFTIACASERHQQVLEKELANLFILCGYLVLGFLNVLSVL